MNEVATHIPTLIVDDQEDLRLLLRLVIERANEGLIVVGEAANGEEALREVARKDPLVVILDEMMPGLSGIETAEAMRQLGGRPIIIICSAYLDDEVVARAKRAGVSGCVPKEDMRTLPYLIRSLVAAR